MKSFLQSDEWADFQKSLGRKVWRIDNVLLIKHNLPLSKNYLYSPHCEGEFLSKSFLEKIKKFAKKENAIFFRTEPEELNEKLVKKFKLKKSQSIQPKKTLILNITKSKEEILKQIHQKTRYNIRLAEKRGVKIRKSKAKEDFEKFWQLLKDTAKKSGFHTHPKGHYKKILDVPGMDLFVAEYQNKIIAANIVLFWDEKATYLHGASDYNYRNLMAPHLLQWHQILEAKKRGCIEYDLWGIDEEKWPGVTRFKKGFGGREVYYPGGYDLVFQPIWYTIYKIARKIL